MLEDMKLDELKELKKVIVSLLKLSSADIIKSNFIKAFYVNTFEDRLYGSLKLFGAKSFRLTSSNPNLLNTPSTGSAYAKHVKECFRTKDKSTLIYQIDYASLEDHVIANLSGDKNKLNIFLMNIDAHTLNSLYYFRDKWYKEFPPLDGETDEDYAIRAYQEIENGNKTLKNLRQMSKGITFGLSYGAQAKKISSMMLISLEEAEKIFDTYNNKLYPGITEFKNKVLDFVKEYGYAHLGLGCRLHSYDVKKDERSLFNACSQFWSILTLLAIHDLHNWIIENNLKRSIKVIATIYDSIYIEVENNPVVIKKLNDFLVPILTKDFIENQIIPNEAEAEIGYDWYTTVKIKNNASKEEIKNAIKELDLLYTNSVQ